MKSAFPQRQEASARISVMVFVAFLLGAAAAAYLVRRPTEPAPGPDRDGPRLSGVTREALQKLNTPVVIRFYALLDPASVPAATRDFAGRVDHLLAAYAEASGGKLSVVRYIATSEEAMKAAAEDRLRPFNLDQGGACYLGLAMTSEARSETFPQLLPEWEAAVEPDLTRALLRLAPTSVGNARASVSELPESAVLDEVKRLVPNLASVSVEEGTRILREKTLQSFGEATKEMQLRIQESEQGLVTARNSGSPAEQQEALKKLQIVQAEQTQKLKQISAQLQAQLAALEHLKKEALPK
jgi:hypothetical protein